MKGEGSSFKMLVIIIHFNQLASFFKASLFHSLEIPFQYPHFHRVQNVNISMPFTTQHADLRCVVFLWNPFRIIAYIALYCITNVSSKIVQRVTFVFLFLHLGKTLYISHMLSSLEYLLLAVSVCAAIHWRRMGKVAWECKSDEQHNHQHSYHPLLQWECKSEEHYNHQHWNHPLLHRAIHIYAIPETVIIRDGVKKSKVVFEISPK